MARPVRRHPTPWPQEGADEPETNVSVARQGGQRGAREGKEIANYDPDVDYKSEGSDPDIEAVNEEEENSETEYAKMDLPQDRTLPERTIIPKLQKESSRYIGHVDLKLWPHGSWICTCSSDLVLKQPDCLSESKD